MIKEYLEALNGLFDLVHCQDSFEKAQKYFDIVEEGLQRLESIDTAEPSEAIKHMEFICKILKEKGIDVKWVFKEDYNTIIQALQRLNKYEQVLGNGRLTDRNYKNTTLDLDSCKPYLRLGQLEDIYEEGKKNE